jgi:hypothetical protein
MQIYTSRTLFMLVLLLLPLQMLGQYTQRIKGSITDKDTKTQLIGVAVRLADIPEIGTVTDEDGNYLLGNVPVGKHTIEISYAGYQPIVIPNVLVTSGKEVLLPVEMEESSQKMNEVEVKAKKEHINEMAIISAKTFDVQETERYAGSRADPARMASNFAGVLGADDSRNDIIIRGNSPQGILWRLEEVDIPNPNHFAVPGTSGGPVSMLNNKVMGNSDFFTGAFPAEYGNSTAGVFDLKFRNGNNSRHEMTAQLGFLGTELSAEGPFSKKSKASYLVTYRYSTLKLFESINVKIGTQSIPNYQDASFKLNFPMGKKANLSFFGLGGLSKIDLIVSKLTEPSEELYGESDRDQYFKSNTGIAGGAFSYVINPTTYTKLIVAQSGNLISGQHDKVFRGPNFELDSMKYILGYDFYTYTKTAHWYLNKKISPKHILRAGVMDNYYQLNMVDSSRQYPPTRQAWEHRLDFQGSTNLLQAYIQYKYRPSDALTFTAGLHAQHLSHNSAKALEPRLAMRWRASNTNVITLGYGLHSQMQALYQYFAHLPTAHAKDMHNYNMGFTRSHHIVGGYEHIFTTDLKLRSEVYYQYLYNVPIERRAGSSFSLLNQGASFSRLFPDVLYNAGKGYNYGAELTVEKTFSHGYYVMFTGSLFNSKANGNDGVYRNTDYNSGFAVNMLGGYEYKLSKNTTLLTGAKVTYTGGRLYSPPEVAASNAEGDFVAVDALRNTLRFPDYFRADLKLGVRINSQKLTHEIAVDLVNILGTKNVLSLTYSPDLAAQGVYPFIKQYQLGFLPLFYYRVDFGFEKK